MASYNPDNAQNDGTVTEHIDKNAERMTFQCSLREDEIDTLGIIELSEILENNNANYEHLVTESEMRELVKTLRKKETKEPKTPITKRNSEIEITYSSDTSQQGAELVGKILEKDKKRKEKLCELYMEIKSFMEKKDLDKKLREEMLTEFGNSKGVLEIGKYVAELREEECPIVVAGETAAGKSSLLNLLLGNDILPHSLLTCTTTICRLRNSKEKEVYVVDKDNQMTLLDLPKDMDAECMKSELKKIVSTEQNKYIYVDIHWPIPILQSRAIIVDTPGIGSSDELTQRLFQYLSKAIAFIYVINSSNAGGVQSDRLEKLFEVQKEGGKMYDFEPSRAIFVCNKWDQVPEAEADTVWTKTIEKLKKHWPNFEESQVFKLSTTEEERRAATPGLQHTSNFHKLLTGISKMIPESLEAKVSRHSSWQKMFLDQLMKRIVSRIKLSKKNEEQKKMLKDSIEDRIKKLRNDLKTVKQKVKAKAEEHCADISNRLFEHLKNRETRGQMFLWSMSELPNGSDIEVVEYQAKKMIIKRINEETRDWCSKNDVNNITKVLTDLFKMECKLIDTDCSEINRMLLDVGMPLDEGLHDYTAQTAAFHDPLFTIHEKVVLAVTSPLWLPLVVGAGLIALPFGVVAGVKDLVKQTKKMNDYNSNRLKYMMDWSESILKEYAQNTIYKLMEETYLKDFNKKVENICDTVIPNQIKADEKFIDNIKNDIRTSSEIRKHYQPLEIVCKCMLGKLLLLQMDYFSGYKLSHKEIREGDRSEELGRGQFSDVHAADVLVNGHWIRAAVKTLRKPLENAHSYIQLTEVQNLRKLHHPNIVELYGVRYKLGSRGKKFLQIYMEFCDESLDNMVIHKKNPRPCYKFKDIKACPDSWRFYLHTMCGVCRGLVHIHSRGFVHRDLKLANILVKNGEAKIADVGLAKEEEDILGTVTGTPTTMAPEVLSGTFYGTEADIFSLGIILWEMWYARPGYTHPIGENEYQFIVQNFSELSFHIKKGTRPDFETSYRPHHKLQFLIKRCWSGDPVQRPVAEEVLKELEDMIPTDILYSRVG